jgi:hypothetical protein
MYLLFLLRLSFKNNVLNLILRFLTLEEIQAFTRITLIAYLQTIEMILITNDNKEGQPIGCPFLFTSRIKFKCLRVIFFRYKSPFQPAFFHS